MAQTSIDSADGAVAGTPPEMGDVLHLIEHGDDPLLHCPVGRRERRRSLIHGVNAGVQHIRDLPLHEPDRVLMIAHNGCIFENTKGQGSLFEGTAHTEIAGLARVLHTPLMGHIEILASRAVTLAIHITALDTIGVACRLSSLIARAVGGAIVRHYCQENPGHRFNFTKSIFILEHGPTPSSHMGDISAPIIFHIYMDAHVCEIFSVLLSIKRSEEFTDNLHKYRCELDPFVFRSLHELYGKEFDDFWNSTTIPKVSDKAICIVERRCHPNLKFCLQNAAYYARGYSIHIFCSEANIDYVHTICGKQFNNLNVYPIFKDIGTPEAGKKEYNDLLMTYQFWNTFKEEHVITIETDSYFLKPIPDSIYEFDYVGSKWISNEQEPGGGGLTYRKVAVMKEILEKIDTEGHVMQDTFASHGIKALNKKYPSLEEGNKYFIEGYISDQGIGVHQWWTFLHNLDEDMILYLIEVYLTLEKVLSVASPLEGEDR